MISQNKNVNRKRRHSRVRSKIIGNSKRPRLMLYKSNTRISAQLIDDEIGKTIMSVTSSGQKGKTLKERADSTAKALAESAKKLNIDRIVFDHGGFGYKGIIKTFAESAREHGLVF
jgi:large subunit ribosomal protein L18